MIYYVLLFLIRRYLFERIWVAVVLNIVLLLAWYVCCFEPKDVEHVLADGKLPVYFIFMLQGAIIGLKGKPKCKPLLDGLLLVLCIATFYGFRAVCQMNPSVSQFQILTLLPMLGFTYYIYKLMNTDAMERLYNNKVCHWVIMTISGLCLEAYLCQFTLITNKLNFLFPLNLLIIFAYILVMAYIVRCIGRWLVQTFQKEDYDWREIVKL